MHNLFSRTRTNSTPHKNHIPSPPDNAINSIDEFGRVSSRTSNRGINVFTPSTPSKKDKKKTKEQDKRYRTLSTTREVVEYSQGAEEAQFPDGSFLPFNLERPRNNWKSGETSKEQDYGYLSYERHVVLGIDQVAKLVDVVVEELETRGGIAEPFIFSTTALDISSSAIKRLINTFLDACKRADGVATGSAEQRWREEARFAGPYELGMCLRWGLARVVRSVAGQDLRGLVSWDHYTSFRDSEAALEYPPNHFESFLAGLTVPLQSVIVRVLSLLTRLTANSTSSGHTPPTLSPLFGPLFFGLGPATLAFHHTYIHYLRATNAMEHLLLAFIRWQDTPRLMSSDTISSGTAAALGVPMRLKEWIKGYPAMLTSVQQLKHSKPQPRKGARTIRVLSVRRNVRMYSPDLVKTASTWAQKKPGLDARNEWTMSKEWERIAPSTLKLPPRYSDAFKKRMDMQSNFHPDLPIGSLSPIAVTPEPSNTSSFSSGAGGSLLGDQDYFGLGNREGEDRFRSLTDMKWGEFESMGFTSVVDKKLQFDLTESARTQRSAKRTTLSWNDFSSAGFSRTDAPLSATLQFSTPIVNAVSSWPAQDAELTKKLKKSQKSLPPFGWDTEPVIGSEEVIEEAFTDVFCDLIYGGGWMDLERGEELDRDCNWALVEYKSLPPSRSTAMGGSDPRTSTSLILFEEFVPVEYRQQLAVPSSSRRRLPSLFSPSSKSKAWKQAATLNGRPYVVGHVPRSPSYREVEFEGLLRGETPTKVISLGGKPTSGSRIQSTISNAPTELQPPLHPVASFSHPPLPPKPSISGPLYIPESEGHPPAKSDEFHSDSTMTPSVKKSRFKLPGGIPVPSPGGIRKTGLAPSEYSSVEFETRMASYSDDEHNGGLSEPESVKQKRRESRSDAWVDILVGQNHRIDGQDAVFVERRKGVRKSDPDLASKEVAQVLAAIHNRSPSPPSVRDRVDRDYGMDHHVEDLDVDEVETVPRTSDVRSRTSETDEEGALAYTEPGSRYDDDDDDDELGAEPISNARQLARQQRRLGYFDIHPERRPTNPIRTSEDDPRDLLSNDSEDDSDDEAVYGAPERPRPLPAVPTLRQDTRREHSPIFSATEIPRLDDGAKSGFTEQVYPRVDSTILSPTVSPLSNGRHEDAPSPAPSKTAALIEMYRERERGALAKPPAPSPVVIPVVLSPPAPLAPSRLPVRSASLPKESQPLPVPPTSAISLSPKQSPQPSPETFIDPPRVPFDETGRASPARYVHGAPLHNVLEEEEEE